MPGYDNTGGRLGDVPNIVDPNLTNRLADQKMPDYSQILGEMLAAKETEAKLGVAMDTQKQIEVLKAHQDADLAKVKADKAASDALSTQLAFDTSPDEIAKWKAGRAAAHTQAIVDAQTGTKQNDELLKELRDAGGNPDDYYAGANADGTTSYNWSAIANDIPKLKSKQSLSAVPTLDANGGIVPAQTSVEAANAPTAGGSLSDTPPATDSGEAAPSADSSPASGPPVKLPAIETPTGPADASAPLAAAPSPTSSPGAVDAAASIPPALQVDPAFVPQMRQQYAQASRNLQMENYKKTGFMLPPAQGEVFKALGLKTDKEIYVDPKTQNSYEAQVTRDAAGRVWGAPKNPVLHARSETQQTIDTEAAKDYQDYTQNQGAARDKNDIATLDTAISVLSDGHTTVSGALTGLLPNGIRNIVMSDKALNVPTLIKSVVQNHLKEIFGGRISNMEVKNAMELVFNPSLGEGNNLGSAQRLRKNLVEALNNKRESMQYFGAHGTLEGYTPKSLTDTDPSSKTSSPTSTLAEGQTGVFNGRKYKLVKDGATGKSNWVGQ